MNLDWQVCSRARLSRDPRFDGKFYIGVVGKRSLLPSDLSCADCERKERAVFPERGCGGGSGVSSVPALSSGKLSGNSGVDGNFEHCVAGFCV